MERLTQDQREGVLAAFKKKYGTDDDPNVKLVCMAFTMWDGDHIKVLARDMLKCKYPQLFNNCNVFVEKGSLY